MSGVTTPATETRDRPRAAPSRHGPVAQLLIAWSPLSLILLVYAAAEWIDGPIEVGRPGSESNRLGLRLHVGATATADRRVFGAVPSVWLQARLAHGSPHWYDAIAALIYVTHFVAIPVVTGLVWFRWRDRFAAWVTAVLVFTVLGISGYVVYPAAPPWLASDLGVIGTVHRLSPLGWGYLRLSPVGALIGSGQAGSNPVAAMPSLHAGSALLVALFLRPVVSRLWGAVLAGYVVLMAVTLVYTGEHYAVDVVAGWLTAAAAVTAGAVTHRQTARRLLRRRGETARHRFAPRRTTDEDGATS